MTDFLSRITAEDPPEAREITVDGETGTIWLRRISAGERRQLLEGHKIQHNPGSGAVMELDLALNEKERQLLVLFCVCDENGRRHFTRLDEVEKIPHRKFKSLANAAEDVNRSIEDDLGKD